MTATLDPLSERPFARCGYLRLEHARVGGERVAVEALHRAPHLGYVLQGSFVTRTSASEHEFKHGELRFSPHLETLQLEMSAGLDVLVGELVGVSPLPLSDHACNSGDAAARELLACVAADSTHPALIEIERWMLLERSRAAAPHRRARWIEDLLLEWKVAPLGSRALCEWSDQAERHRSTLHRSFRRSVGIDPSGWLLRERLRRAWERLETEQAIGRDRGRLRLRGPEPHESRLPALHRLDAGRPARCTTCRQGPRCDQDPRRSTSAQLVFRAGIVHSDEGL
jgi:AraC-like DNA-binding protein